VSVNTTTLRVPVTPVRVVVAEDDLLTREGIQRLFETNDGLDVVGAVADLPSLWRAVEGFHPDVVVTNVGLPPTRTDEGIRFSVEVRRRRPETGVVVLGEEPDPDLAAHMLGDGVSGRAYLLKDRVVDGAAFAETVRTVAAGGSHVDIRVVQRLLNMKPARRGAALAKLTPRDGEILRLMAEGRSNAAIARELAVTGRAVERHVGSIFGKLDIPDSPAHSRRVLAVLAYLENGRDGGRGH
jgi:DNA-binding NarL/FixJ family response regulator